MNLLLYCILVLNPNRAYEFKWQRDTRVIQLIHTDLRVLTLGLAIFTKFGIAGLVNA